MRNSGSTPGRRTPRSTRAKTQEIESEPESTRAKRSMQRKGRATFTTRAADTPENVPPGRRVRRSTRVIASPPQPRRTARQRAMKTVDESDKSDSESESSDSDVNESNSGDEKNTSNNHSETDSDTEESEPEEAPAPRKRVWRNRKTPAASPPPRKPAATRKGTTKAKKRAVVSHSSDTSEASDSNAFSDSDAKDNEDVDAVEDSDTAAESESDEDSDSGSSQTRRPTRATSRGGKQSKSKANGDPRADYYFVSSIDTQNAREQEMLTRFRYLLGLGDLFRDFVDYRAKKDPKFEALLDRATKANKDARKKNSTAVGKRSNARAQRSSKSTDIAEVEDMLDSDEKVTVFSESPGFVTGKLRQYQIDGLNWLISLFTNDINGILADEMGLGKTFQTISFLAYLRSIQNIRGPHLVIAPKSTIQNWAREFETWTPDMDVLVIAGDKDERSDLIKTRLLTAQFDVCITSYELLIREKNYLKRIAWQYIIVDEAHRLKNEESILSKLMRVLYSRHRLLITGTPLQNNLHELWALLNFLLPDVFSDAEVFDEWFAQEETDESESEESKSETEDAKPKADEKDDKTSENNARENNARENNASEDDASEDKDKGQVVDRLRSLLSPFLLRRVKRDVEHSLLPKKEINLYVSMTDMQIEWYRRLLEKDLDAINSSNKGGSEKRMRLLNTVMQLRKCCNHPYLFEGAEPGPPFTTDEHLVFNSGKMILLDKLLRKLNSQGSRVLIFSQMSRMLDILEDYCNLRGYEYCRIDGTTQHEDRIAAIDEYNRPGSDKFVFLLTTRAGGLGINLTTADQVLIYDSDWNPQADLQAMDRAHRIGQTKQVYVYRLIVEHAIEEKVLERAAHKLRLDQLVIQQGSGRNSAQEKAKAAASKEELADMIRHGAQEVLDNKDKNAWNDMSIDDLIASGEKRTQELNEKYVSLGLDELIKLTFDKPPANQAPIVNKNPKQNPEDDYRHHHRRARNAAMFSEEAIAFHPHSTRAPKQVVLHDFQFYPPELQVLQARELAWYRKATGISLSSEDYSEDEEDESERANAEIEHAKPLTAEELERKEKLIDEGFPSFTRRDFFHFIHLLVDFGGHRRLNDAMLDELCAQWPEKPADELKRYFRVFCERHEELSDIDRYNHMLEEGANKQRKQNERIDILKNRVESTATPMTSMRITQPTGGSASKHRFTEQNDRFLLLQMYKIGLGDADLADKICSEIRVCGLFEFDWYFMSRTPAEINRRCTSLLNVISKEKNASTDPTKGQKRKGRPPNNPAGGRKADGKRTKVA